MEALEVRSADSTPEQNEETFFVRRTSY